MNWWLRDFDLLSVLLRGLVLACEALTVGGVLFLISAARLDAALSRRLQRAVALAAGGCAAALVASTGSSAWVVIASAGLPWADMRTASFVEAGACGAVASLLLAGALGLRARLLSRVVWALLAAVVLGASVALSHAASRLDGRVLLLALTSAHHLGTALWIGAMPFLLLALRGLAGRDDVQLAGVVARAYSRMALVGVPMLVLAGVGLSWKYAGSWAGLFGSSYGVLIIAKTYLLLAAGLLGLANQRLLSRPGETWASVLRVRRFGEVEIGLGFTAVLAAASLTAQSPAADLPRADLVSRTAIVERFRPVMPRWTSPPVKALAPATSMEEAMRVSAFAGPSESDANDRAWSEYNHHWAGLVVVLAGVLALVSRTARDGTLRALARQWPLLFLGLAAFVLLRADPENWPLGPRPFWASMASPDVLEHRLFAVLIAGFALFEWNVERRRGAEVRWSAYVFPLLCALGGAALLTHTHAAGDAHEEMLAELSHMPIAVLGATAGWGRWLELRLPGSRAARWAGYVWPACLLFAGLVLVDYRES